MIIKSIKNRIYKNKSNKNTKELPFTDDYLFENRSNNENTLCIILAGYKEFTWDIVFERINEFSEKDIDICIVSSGLYSKKLSEVAKKYNWSYISIKKNSVTLAQNTTIKLFPNAKYIYKLDEDIFVTKNFFKTIRNTYNLVQEEGEYNVGFVAPIIPINGYCHVLLLKKLNLIQYFEKNFEKIKYAAGPNRMIENNSDVAKFMWGENNLIPHIDDLNEKLSNLPFKYSASTIRFSIGAIYFSRDLWEDMNYFDVIDSSRLGIDEVQLCTYCIKNSKGMIISENCCVGHLSFGLQNEVMKEYYKNNPQHFEIKND